MADICACEVHESGRDLVYCMHHSQRIGEHRQMFSALDAISRSTDATAQDLAAHAKGALVDVKYWHRDHPVAVAKTGSQEPPR